MQRYGANYLDALSGSFRYRVQVDAWRGGRLVAANLPVSGGTLTISDGQAVRSRLTLSVADPDGAFAPTKMSDALAPFGSELNVRAGITIGRYTETFSLGWFPIQSAEVHESFAIHTRPDEPDRPYRTSRGAVVEVEALDRAALVAEDKFLAREQPTAGASVFAEVRRILKGRHPYRGAVGSVSDKTIPAKFTYDDDRLKALVDLADMVNAEFVFLPNGSAALASRTQGAVVWTIPDGETGVRVSMTRKLQRDGVYNAVVARGQTVEDNKPIQSVKVLAEGPLSYAGPFGRVPYFTSSPILTSQEAVSASATTTLNRLSTVKPQEVHVVCVLNPALEVGDTVRLPVVGGAVDGRVTEIAIPVSSSGTTMSLQVAVDPLALVVPA